MTAKARHQINHAIPSRIHEILQHSKQQLMHTISDDQWEISSVFSSNIENKLLTESSPLKSYYFYICNCFLLSLSTLLISFVTN